MPSPPSPLAPLQAPGPVVSIIESGMNYEHQTPPRWLGSPIQTPTYANGTRHRPSHSDAGRLLSIPTTPLSCYPASPHSPLQQSVPAVHRGGGDFPGTRTSSHSKYRRVLPEGGYLSPLLALTTQLASTYQICDPNYNYSLNRNPRRVLTDPHEGKLNNGYDNEESDYILWVNDVLGTDEGRRYLVLNVLGKGTFGQVVKCQNMATKEVVAVKVIKNKPAYLNQSMMEVSILEHIQQHVDQQDRHNLLRLKDKFVHKEHLCIVFELLSSNLYEVIKKNQFRGLNIRYVRAITAQLLDALSVLKDARLIHCDLKPENILLRRNDSTAIKVIDFGSACHERQSVYTYIQSRFYRSPEVILGLPYTSSIDMWSLGCIVAELFLGLPIFPGTSEYNQWYRIVESLGAPPNWMLEMGKNTDQFMKKYIDQFGNKRYRLRSLEEHVAEFGTDEKPMKKYFNSTDIREIIMSYPLLRNDMTKQEVDAEMREREALADFVKGLLNFNPFERWTPHQARMHPFITGKQFSRPFVPETTPSASHPPGYPQHPRQNQYIPQQSHSRQVSQSQQVSQPGHMQPPMMQPQPFPQAAQGQMAYPQVPSAPQLQLPLHQNLQPPMPSHAANTRSRRMRAATIGQPEPIPRQLQKAAARVDPADAIHAQPSPAYVPPPDLYKRRPP